MKRLPTMRETWVQSLGRKDLLEKERATHSCILVWKIPWTEEPGRLQSVGSQRVDTTERLNSLALTHSAVEDSPGWVRERPSRNDLGPLSLLHPNELENSIMCRLHLSSRLFSKSLNVAMVMAKGDVCIIYRNLKKNKNTLPPTHSSITCGS